jgi:transcriptional regulator with XRE-family HTH domain
VSVSIPKNRVELGRRIKEKRGEMTAKALAEKAGISASYLSEVERGVSAISSEKLLSLARHLGVGVEYLLEGEENATHNIGPQDVQIPAALSEAAESLDLSFYQTLRLLQARKTLRARRTSSEVESELNKEGWVKFFQRVKDFMEE